MEDHSSHGDGSDEATRGYAPASQALPGGLALAQNGLRLDPSDTRFDAEDPVDWSFRVVDDDGAIVTDFEETHGRRGHLVVVRRDLTRFQHLHPELASDGTWRVERFTLPEPGVYRAFVDVVVDGEPTTLGFDLFTSDGGPVAPRPDASTHASADGYEIDLLTAAAAAREYTQLPFEVRRDGELVSELGRYLGALGHLVALREGDLAYLHVHPETTAPDSGRVEFGVRFPTPGRYRLFLQTRPEGNLVTAQFDVCVDE